MPVLSNQRLLDVLARHQVYVEGLKADYYRNFNPFLNELQKQLKFLFANANIDDFSTVTKRDLNILITQLIRLQKNQYNVYTDKVIGELEDFMKVDNVTAKVMLGTLIANQGEDESDEEPISEDDADNLIDESNETSNLYPVGYFGKDTSKLWSSILNAPIPANGMLPEAFLASFSLAAQNAIVNLVRKAYANNVSIAEMYAEMFGTAALNNKDGVFNRIFNQHNAVVATLIQHVSSIVQGGVQSLLFGQYRWVSVIDNSTTEICKGRNNQVFKYGAGPLPPAHIHCRSKTVPVVPGELQNAPTYYTWMKNQPKAFVADALGDKAADDLASGKTKASDMTQFTNAKAITLDEFASKLDNILKR